MGILTAAREYMERELAAAEARQDRMEVHVIAERICEVIEQEDFGEWNRLLVVWIIQSESCSTA